MAKRKRQRSTPARKKIAEARAILDALNVPREQRNDRSALTLLALLSMKPDTPWSEADAPFHGITEMMDYFRDHFRKRYAPNTRETVRRQTIHQFVQMELVVANPDDPSRPVNSPDNRYQVHPTLLKLAKTYGTAAWPANLVAFLRGAKGLRRLQPRERDMPRIPVQLPNGAELKLTSGGHNVLIKEIVEEFCPTFTPGGVVIYVGDTGDKYCHFDAKYLSKLGVAIDEHGKMPDVVIHLPKRNWLVLIEAVTSHGPVNLKRHNELKDLFRRSSAGLVFVTAFQSRRAMMKYLPELAWETEVWAAESPTHLIHFNGERFLGPYEARE